MNRYETNSKGTSPALSALLNKFADMPRSAFDESRRKLFDVAPFAIIPFETFLMFPNSEIYLSYDITAITKNPTINRMLSAMNIETRTYVCNCSDLWEGWNNFITRGRTGKVDLNIPRVRFNSNNYRTFLPYNPAHYLNIAPAVYYAKNQSFEKNQGFQLMSEVDSHSNPIFDTTGLLDNNFNYDSSKAYKEGINALPFVMYCKIAKEYQNANLLQNNPNWYPENENHDLILPYSATIVTNATYSKWNLSYGSTFIGSDGTTHTANVQQPDNSEDSFPWLNILYYRQRKGNYFNTSSPFPDLIRGDVPTLQVLGATVNGNLDFSNAIIPQLTDDGEYSSIIGVDLTKKLLGVLHNGTNVHSDVSLGTDSTLDTSENAYMYTSGTWVSARLNKSDILKDALNKGIISNAQVQGINFSMNAWRRLATLTVFKERMARTDGSYNQMIQAQFQHNPQWHEHSVKYCGGSVQPLVFSEVVQTSEDGSTPLGTTAGRAVSSSSNNSVHIKVDDYSIMMSVMTLTPDDYYSQGIDRMWTEITQSEQYFPILNNLEPQAIKNKELFISGTDSTDEDVFAYQELFSHFKSRQNQVSGLMSLPISKVGNTGAYLFNRLFTSTPQFNNSFVTGKFTDNENLCFASTEQAQFAISLVSSMKYIAPIPAVTQPSDMGISY